MIEVQLCALGELVWSRLLHTERPELFEEQDARAIASQLPKPSWDPVWAPLVSYTGKCSTRHPTAAPGWAEGGGAGTAKPLSLLLETDICCEGFIGFPL